MKKTTAILFLLLLIFNPCRAQPVTVETPQFIGQKNRNQAVGKGFEVPDTCSLDSAVRLGYFKGGSGDKMLIIHSNGYVDTMALCSGCNNQDTIVTDTISSLQILNSYASPDTILPAPGIGWQWNVMNEQGYYYALDTNYNMSAAAGLYEGDTLNTLELQMGGATVTQQTLNSWSGISGTYSSFKITTSQSLSGTYSPGHAYFNQPVTFYNPGSNPTPQGHGYLVITIIAHKTH